jgi:tRNA wybutosine-synthesizing protein 1
MVILNDKLIESFERKHYGIVGKHSAVEICSWNKKALIGLGECYKEKFYGVNTHKCAQITPAVAWCEHNCLHCWRPMEMFAAPTEFKEPFDSPDEIIEGVIRERKKLLTGFGGNEKVPREKYEDALDPDHWALSLSGEAGLYPHLPELIRKIKERKNTRTVFYVTNGQEPQMIQKLIDEDSEPTQIYVSLLAPNKELYKELCLPFYKDGWERLMKSFDVWKKMKTRKVLRITHIKDINDKEKEIKEFSKLIENTDADFIEIKAYMYLGYSRNRLKKENMPTHEEVKEFTKEILKNMNNFENEDEDEKSRIVLLKNKKTKFTTKIQCD